MCRSITLFLVMATVSSACAGIDLGVDSFGIYFDSANNVYVLNDQPAYTPFTAYLVLANPSGATNGFECTVAASGAAHFVLSTTLGGSGALDVDPSANGYAVGAASNYPVVDGAIVLCTWQLMLQAQEALEFRVSCASIPSLPSIYPVVTGDGVLRQCGVRSGSVNAPVAYINNPSVTPVEMHAYGTIKSLFR